MAARLYWSKRGVPFGYEAGTGRGLGYKLGLYMSTVTYLH
jgi:hypothetical protein